MNFIQKVIELLGIVGDKAKGIEKLNILSGNSSSVDKSNNVTYNGPVLNIHIEELKVEDAKKIIELLKSEAIPGTKIIEAETEEVLEEGQKLLDGGDEILEYFRKLLTPEDIAILKSSIVLSRIHDKGAPVAQLKQVLVEKHGHRGAVISNLCSANYFETYLKPLNEELSQRKDYTIETFRTYFDDLIADFPIAIFISRRDSSSNLLPVVTDRISKNRSYGIDRLNIHAIGTDNVKTASELVEKLVESSVIISEDIRNDASSDNKVAVIRLML